jgi:apolipoprotein N-acyltransferase
VWLAVGALLSLVAVHSAWDVPLAAWLYPLFLLRFTRTGRPLAGAAWMWGVAVVGAVFWIWRADVLSPALLPIAVLLGTVKAVPYVVDRLVATRLSGGGGLAATLVFPAAEAGVEMLMATYGPTGAIYGVLGTTQHAALPLIQTASVTGVYGVSFLVAWCSSVAVHVWAHGGRWPLVRRPVCVYAGVLALVLALGGARLAFAPPSSETVRVAGISLSRSSWDAEVVPAFREFDSLETLVAADRDRVREVFAPIHDELLALTEREAAAGADLVVWTESAAHTREEDKEDLLRRVGAVAREHGVHVEIGVSVYTQRAPHIRNQAILLTPEGEVAWTYDKAHPIPVLEPYDAGPGELPVLDTPFGRITTAICYDVDFPATLRRGADLGADILLLPSNEWEGISRFHAQESVFRTVEGGYAMVRPVNRGRSTAVDHQGRVIAATDYFGTDQQTMVASVPTEGVTTVYGRFGDVFAWLCVLGVAGAAVLAVRRRPAP